MITVRTEPYEMVLKRIQTLLVCLFLFSGATAFGPSGAAEAQDRLPRILQGEETDEFPAVGIVGSLFNGGFCTGTLISPRHVLTAAHCADFIESPTSGTFEVGGEIYETADIFIHPDYNWFTLANDIAILELNRSVTGVEPSEIFRGTPLVGDLLFIVGFGGNGTAGGGSDGTFGSKRVGVTTIDDVTDTLVSWTFDDASESNTAAGDSGGPGYLDIEGSLFIACVTSGGTEPDSSLGDFAFNTRVDAFADWIDFIVVLTDQPPQQEPPQEEPPLEEPPPQQEPTQEEPPQQEPTQEEPPQQEPTQEEENVCEGFWAQPFPFLQLLIDFLTSILEALNDVNEESDQVVVESPGATPADDPIEIASDDPTSQPDPSETPADGVDATETQQALQGTRTQWGRGGNRVRERPSRGRRYSRR